MKKNGFVMSTYVYMLLVFFLLLLTTMLTVLNNTKLLSNKLRNDTTISSGLLDKNFSFVLLGDKKIIIFKDDEYIDPGFIAKTNNGKELEENIKITGEVNNKEAGEYTLTYKLTYNGISKELKRTVTVIDDFAYYINSLLDTEKGNIDGLQKIIVTYNGNTYDTGTRYTGSDPNNYVLFNCDDDGSNCETWRIIGVFDVDDGNGNIEKRVKITNRASKFFASWDSSASDVNKGWGINQWFPSKYEDGTYYEGADLYQLLNGFYIDTTKSCTYCNGSEQETCTNTCTKESLTSKNMKPLTSSAKSMIDSAIWYTYAVSVDEFERVTSANVDKAYLQEMGISKQYTGKGCSSGEHCTDKVVRTTSGNALIGLTSSSDNVYADGWLYNTTSFFPHTLSPAYTSSRYSNHVRISYRSNVGHDSASAQYTVLPTTYLNSSIKVVGGDGTSENPYKLSI